MVNQQSLAQTREQARAEYDQATRGLLFTKDFQTRQEALMHDEMATIGERVMAWIVRRSWGECSLYALCENGEPAYQRDCVNDLGNTTRKPFPTPSATTKEGLPRNARETVVSCNFACPSSTLTRKVPKVGGVYDFFKGLESRPLLRLSGIGGRPLHRRKNPESHPLRLQKVADCRNERRPLLI